MPINPAALANANSILGAFETNPAYQGHTAWGVNRTQLVKQLADRLSGSQGTWPQQGGTALCGPAAFMFCLINDRPDLYVSHIIDLWLGQPATLGQRGVNPSAQVTANGNAQVLAGADVNAVDWISMASLRNDSPDLNPFADYDHPSDQFSAITRPKYMKGWFEAVGARTLLDNTSEIISTADWKELLALASCQTSAWVLLLVSARMFAGTLDGPTNKNHWVVLNDPITFFVNGRPLNANSNTSKPDLDTAFIKTRIFTWGDADFPLKKERALPHLSHFLQCFHGGMVFSSIP